MFNHIFKLCVLVLSVGILFPVLAFSQEEQSPRIITFETKPTANFSSYKLKTLEKLELASLFRMTLGSTKQFTAIERDSRVLSPVLQNEMAIALSQGADGAAYEQLVGAEIDYIALIKVLSFESIKKYQPLEIPGSFVPRETVSAEIEIKVITPSGIIRYEGRKSSRLTRQLNSINAEERPASRAASFSRVKELFSLLVDKAVADMADKLAPIVVLRVQNTSKGVVVTLNRGEKAGLKVGQKLEISEPPETVLDSTTGQAIEVESFPLGEVELIRVRQEQAHALVPEEITVYAGYRVTLLP